MIQTAVQLRTEVYDALFADVTLQGYLGNPMRLFWLGRPTVENNFPLMTLSRLDSEVQYAFGVVDKVELVTFELKVYTNVDDASASGYKADLIFERLKAVMAVLDYMNINTPAEFLDESINKMVSTTRWERLNC